MVNNSIELFTGGMHLVLFIEKKKNSNIIIYHREPSIKEAKTH